MIIPIFVLASGMSLVGHPRSLTPNGVGPSLGSDPNLYRFPPAPDRGSATTKNGSRCTTFHLALEPGG